MSRLNKHKYPGAKRLMLEAQELKDNTEDYWAQPIDDNLFEWHFTVRGPPDTAFEGGYYHGRMSFPTEYPMKPPSIIVFTPNGRFETNRKICLSISGYHPETWQPSWSVRTALLALIAFMPTKPNRAIGSLDYNDEERRKLASSSRTWCCETCGPIRKLLVHPNSTNADVGQPYGSDIDSNQNPVIGREISENVESNGSQNHGNNSLNETRDSSPQSGDSKSSNSDACNSSTIVQQQQSVTNLADNKINPVDSPHLGEPVEQSSAQNQLDTSSDDLSNRPNQIAIDDRRRTYPSPLVLKSIFILLFLLILRRVVMVIQS